MKKLHVKKVTTEQLAENGWPMYIPGFRYIRCNKKGKINWDKAPVYTEEELIVRNNVKIIR